MNVQIQSVHFDADCKLLELVNRKLEKLRKCDYLLEETGRTKSVSFDLHFENFSEAETLMFLAFINAKFGYKLKKQLEEIDPSILEIYHDNHKLNNVHPRIFELIIGKLLEHLGFDVTVTAQTKDGGYDIIAEKQSPIPFRALVECKTARVDKPIGIGAIRAFGYVVNDKDASCGVVFTNTYFSPAVIKEALKKYFKLILFEGKKVLGLIREYVESRLFKLAL